MIRVNAGSLPDEEQLYAMLLNCDYRRFTRWPGADPQRVADYLCEDIRLPGSRGDIITASDGDRLVALLTYADLAWDSRHFGHKSGYLPHLLTNTSLDRHLVGESLDRILSVFIQRCLDTNVEFVYADVGSWEFDKSIALQAAHFRYIVTQIDGFVEEISEPAQAGDDIEVSPVRPDEIEFFQTLAARSYFLGGRFYADPCFDRLKVDQMYASLVRASYESGQILLTYRVGGQPVGLFICKRGDYPHFDGLRVAFLRFLVVDPRFRGRRIARDFFVRTVQYLKDYCDLVVTGLEVHNTPSLNVHAKLSFSFNYTHNAYHWRT